MSESYYLVGIIAGTHGIRGDVRVLPRTDFPEKRFRKGSKLSIRKEGQPPHGVLTIHLARPHKNMWLVSFENFLDISLVESWRGFQLCVSEQELMPLPEGHYYIHQLVGLKVYTEEGQFVGDLIEVLQPGANDVYVVRGPLQKQDVLIPAIPNVIKKVDLEAGTILVHLMPGLLAEDE